MGDVNFTEREVHASQKAVGAEGSGKKTRELGGGVKGTQMKKKTRKRSRPAFYDITGLIHGQNGSWPWGGGVG